jgi:hypothetical protein
LKLQPLLKAEITLAAPQEIGYRHGPADVLQKLSRGDAVDPSLYYAWLNEVQ